jgi:cytochrome P450
MHQHYGPVVRIMPNILHVNDPSFVDILYTQSPLQKRERGQTVLNMFTDHLSMLPTRDHDLHRRRRAILGRFFSQQRVRQLAPIIERTLSDLFRRLESWHDTDGPFSLNAAYKAATKDVIQAYALGEGDKCLLKDDFNAAFFATMAAGPLTHISVHFHWVPAFMTKLPASVITSMSPHVLAFIHFVEVPLPLIVQVNRAQAY